jgi:hypothetical protein
LLSTNNEQVLLPNENLAGAEFRENPNPLENLLKGFSTPAKKLFIE